MMVTLHVKCGICGHEAVVTFHQREVPGRRNPVPIIPQLWICDLHSLGDVQ